MCTLLLAIQHHRDYPWIIAANRDEYLDRPTAPM
ncbi:MAG: NRDE family protein, partial [Desulfosarcinaceae bacterium]|nr:NRDE family protein [Desulfosarcinaceae bacterium]